MALLAEITAHLIEPFAFDDIGLLPKGKMERNGKALCMALPYADPRVYQDRLNAIACGEWSTPAPVVVVAGNKLICYVTVILCGVPHTDVGEATNNEENTGTEAWAQAFKRACSQFGLGRYLYDLEKEWVPFNVQKKQIELDNVGKCAIVRKMYAKAGIAVPGTAERVRDDVPIHKSIHTTAQPPDASPSLPAPAQSPAIQRMIQVAQSRVVALGASWEQIKATALGGEMSDSALVMGHFAKINSEITRQEKERTAA